jgi:hypothetical protein
LSFRFDIIQTEPATTIVTMSTPNYRLGPTAACPEVARFS